MKIPEELVHGVEGYEYGIQHHYGPDNEWRMTSTNHFDGWYPSEKSMKNALAQLRATRYGWKSGLIYRPVRRPYGAMEVLPG